MNRPTLHSAEKNSPLKRNPSGMKSGVGRDEEGPITNSGLPACWAGLGLFAFLPAGRIGSLCFF